LLRSPLFQIFSENCEPVEGMGLEEKSLLNVGWYCPGISPGQKGARMQWSAGGKVKMKSPLPQTGR
jgi:hypothetical protein